MYSDNRVTIMLQLTHDGPEIAPRRASPLLAGLNIKPAEHNWLLLIQHKYMVYCDEWGEHAIVVKDEEVLVARMLARSRRAARAVTHLLIGYFFVLHPLFPCCKTFTNDLAV